MERIEEFAIEGGNFIYIDFSGIKTESDFAMVTEKAERIMAGYPEHSLYTIANIEDVRLDTRAKEKIAVFLEKNKPYVKYGVVIGIDGIKKIMLDGIFEASGRGNMLYAFSKEKAIELLLQQEMYQ